MPAQYAIAFDFETGGFSPSTHSFFSLGAVLINVDTGIELGSFLRYARTANVDADRMGYPLPSEAAYYTFDPRCKIEFWDKHPAMRDAVLTSCANAGPPEETIADFLTWVKTVTRAEVNGESIASNCKLITDNAAFDVAFLRAYAQEDIFYVFGEYRGIMDVGDFYRGMALVTQARLDGIVDIPAIEDGNSRKLALDAINRGIRGSATPCNLPDISHLVNHDPLDDARRIGLTYSFIAGGGWLRMD